MVVVLRRTGRFAAVRLVVVVRFAVALRFTVRRAVVFLRVVVLRFAVVFFLLDEDRLLAAFTRLSDTYLPCAF